MKKIMMFLLCGGLLVGCASSAFSVRVSDQDKVLASDDKMSLTKQGYFEFLLKQYGAGSVLDQTLDFISEKEVTDQKVIDKLVDESVKEYTKYADGDLDKYAKKLGYESKDEFIEKVLRADAKIEALHNKYIQSNFDKLLTEYQVTSLKMINFKKESEALKFIKETKTEEAFDKKLKEVKDDGEDAGVVTKNTSMLDSALTKELGKLSAVKKDGLYSKAIKLSNDEYAVIYLYDTAHKNKEDITSSLASISELAEKITGIYLKKYHFTVHDEAIQESIKKLSTEYIE